MGEVDGVCFEVERCVSGRPNTTRDDVGGGRTSSSQAILMDGYASRWLRTRLRRLNRVVPVWYRSC